MLNILLRAAPVLAGAIVAVAFIACGGDDASDPTTPTVTPTPTSTPQPPPPGGAGIFEEFRPYALEIESALKARDAEFFVKAVDLVRTECPNEFEPQCDGKADGTIIEGVPAGHWRSEGSLLTVADFRTNVRDYLSNLEQPSLYALAAWEGEGGLSRGPGVLAIVMSADDPSSTRVFAFARDGDDWVLRTMLIVPILAEEWLSGDCRDCYHDWQRWEGESVQLSPSAGVAER